MMVLIIIDPKWTDAEVKQFRKNIRRQNICARQDLKFHSNLLERKKYTKDKCIIIKKMDIDEGKVYLPDLWVPSIITFPNDRNKWHVEIVVKPDEQAIKKKVVLAPILIPT